MTTLKELNIQAASCLESKKFKTEISTNKDHNLEDYVKTLRELGLNNQAESLLTQQKESQYQIHFPEVNLYDLPKLLFNDQYKYEIIKSEHAGYSHRYGLLHSTRYMYLPFISKSVGYLPVAYYIISGLTHLKDPIPYGVALTLKELTESSIFENFVVFGPAKAFNLPNMKFDPVLVDPIVLGEKDNRFYFIAMWGQDV